ncbi:DUF4190 domain-containing protein [Frigoribacterium faeni]|uniref:DUF4190 domain-containing protein n=1 Tax=Frigoribacterium faeni TaxID=145483 RepID=UPI00141A982A|nr:DUF4190 domain-containing protein [Frigoribacterium faeni]NIJ03837.1 CHASE2 domain-containing sensor protein [Frigoribacterium faeni]
MTNQAPLPTTAPAATGGLHSPLSVTSLVLGIASVALGFTLVVPVVGLVLGLVARRREPDGRTMALVGVISSAVMLLGSLAVLLVGLVVAVPVGLLHLLG